MSFTVQNLCDEALRLIHAQRPNQSFATTGSSPTLAAGSQEYQICIDALNQLLDGFSVDGATIYQVVHETFALTGGGAYNNPITWGPGGNISTARPEKIRSAAVIQSAGQMPVEIVAVERFGAIVDRTATGLFADLLTCDYAYPQANVFLWPAPSSGTLDLWSYKPFAQVVYLSDVIALPPGYLETLKFNLAVSLAAEFTGAVLEPWVAQKAAEAKGRLAALNAVTVGMPSAPLGRTPLQQPMREVDIEQGKPQVP